MPRAAFWVLGVGVALLGVLIARVLAPAVPADYQTLTTAVGVTVALLGVLTTALGAGR